VDVSVGAELFLEQPSSHFAHTDAQAQDKHLVPEPLALCQAEKVSSSPSALAPTKGSAAQGKGHRKSFTFCP